MIIGIIVLNRGLAAFASGDLPAALAHLDAATPDFQLLKVPTTALRIDRCAVLLAAGLASDALAEADAAVREVEQSGQVTSKAELLLVAAGQVRPDRAGSRAPRRCERHLLAAADTRYRGPALASQRAAYARRRQPGPDRVPYRGPAGHPRRCPAPRDRRRRRRCTTGRSPSTTSNDCSARRTGWCCRAAISAVLAPAGADELLGLVSSLLPLGTAGIIAAIVPLNDYAVVPLMVDLHQFLRAGLTLAEAAYHVRRGAGDDPVQQATATSLITLGAG